MAEARGPGRTRAWALAACLLAPVPAAAAGTGSAVDHSPWQSFLARYLDTSAADGVNRLRYGTVTAADRQGLEAYLRALQAVKPSALDRREGLAYWINLYNAQTVDVVLRHYPVASIRDIALDTSHRKAGPWDARLLKVEGRALSLNDIENSILRPQWKNNLVHFALNCASLGCPDLAPQAYTAANSDRLMRRGAAGFINSPRGAEFTGTGLRLSSLFDWYRDDFGKNERQVLEFLSAHARPGHRDSLLAYSGHVDYAYDWRLNDAPAGSPRKTR